MEERLLGKLCGNINLVKILGRNERPVIVMTAYALCFKYVAEMKTALLDLFGI